MEIIIVYIDSPFHTLRYINPFSPKGQGYCQENIGIEKTEDVDSWKCNLIIGMLILSPLFLNIIYFINQWRKQEDHVSVCQIKL